MEKQYFELTRMIERLHRQFIDVLKAELNRTGVRDINGVQALLLTNIGHQQISIRDLVERGYIETRPGASDRRQKLLRLSPQGAALDLQGDLWVNEHGARGGDEVNRIRRGANYGWPVIAYGRHYSGAKIGEGTAKPGMEQPEHYWDPSIAPSGMMFYSGKLWPAWRGDLFVGSLKFDYISRLDGEPLREREQIKSAATERVRDIREAPDGSIWFLSVGQGTLYRMTPAN